MAIFFNNCPSELIFIPNRGVELAVGAGAAAWVQHWAKLKPWSLNLQQGWTLAVVSQQK